MLSNNRDNFSSSSSSLSFVLHVHPTKVFIVFFSLLSQFFFFHWDKDYSSDFSFFVFDLFSWVRWAVKNRITLYWQQKIEHTIVISLSLIFFSCSGSFLYVVRCVFESYLLYLFLLLVQWVDLCRLILLFQCFLWLWQSDMKRTFDSRFLLLVN